MSTILNKRCKLNKVSSLRISKINFVMVFLLLLSPIMNTYAMTLTVMQNDTNTMIQHLNINDFTEVTISNDCCVTQASNECTSNMQCCSHCVSLIKSMSNKTLSHYFDHFYPNYYPLHSGLSPIPLIKPPRS